MTGVVVVLFRGGVTVMPGSTLGGVIAPFCCDIRSLSVAFGGAIFSGGAILSGGGEAAFGGATGTVGLTGDAGCGFCASAGEAARINAVSESARNMVRYPSSSRP
jgi:hypothetical protein